MKLPRYFATICPKWAGKLEKLDEKDPLTWDKLHWESDPEDGMFLGHEYMDIAAEAWRNKETGKWHFARNTTDNLKDPQCLECGLFSRVIWDMSYDAASTPTHKIRNGVIYRKFYRELAKFTTHFKKGNHTMLAHDEWCEKVLSL